MNIVLTGFMASGKTEISKSIARLSAYKLADTDDMIVNKMRMTINEIFDKYGEEYFRKIECEIIAEAANLNNMVISTGGGAVLKKANMTALRKSGVIFNLSPDFSVIADRLEAARKTRPLLKHDSLENIKKRFHERQPFYADCDYVIKIIHGRTPDSYAEEILKIMERKEIK